MFYLQRIICIANKVTNNVNNETRILTLKNKRQTVFLTGVINTGNYQWLVLNFTNKTRANGSYIHVVYRRRLFAPVALTRCTTIAESQIREK